MALIKCNECGKEMSDHTKQCPNCGCPITQAIEVNHLMIFIMWLIVSLIIMLIFSLVIE